MTQVPAQHLFETNFIDAPVNQSRRYNRLEHLAVSCREKQRVSLVVFGKRARGSIRERPICVLPDRHDMRDCFWFDFVSRSGMSLSITID